MLRTSNPYRYKLVWVTIAMILLLCGCAVKDTNSMANDEINNQDINVQEEIEVLSKIWAEALISRDGSPRYEMMSEQAKQKFKEEQIKRSGEDWNFNIGYSSPWVIEYEIEIYGMAATITYTTQTSEPAYYKTMDTITFLSGNDGVIVDNYRTDIEVNVNEAT